MLQLYFTTSRRYSSEEKNIIILDIINKRRTVREIADGKEESPSEGTVRKWIKQYKQTGELFKDDNNNDAIPSWSGYSYQGKVALLCSLEKINELFDDNNDEDIKNWDIQLEKLQDFVFIKNKKEVSLWQVKATMSNKSYKRYIDALDKLLEDRQSCGNDGAECVLVSAVDIIDWSSSDNTFKNDVRLYKYRGNVVAVNQISESLKFEIKRLLDYIEKSIDVETAYLALCSLIDDKVAEFHSVGKKNQYIIHFQEIISRIQDTEQIEKRIGNLKIREEVYNNIMNKLQQGMQIACDECEKDCNKESCGMTINSRLIQKISLVDYMRSIKPHIEPNNIPDYNIDDAGDYTDGVCYVLREATDISIRQENNIIYILCYGGKIKVVPTLLDLSQGKEARASRKLQQIGDNEWLVQNIGDKILLGNTQNNIFGTKLDKFTSIHLNDVLVDGKISNKKLGIKYIFERQSVQKKATTVSQDIIIIDNDYIVEYLKELKCDE